MDRPMNDGGTCPIMGPAKGGRGHRATAMTRPTGDRVAWPARPSPGCTAAGDHAPLPHPDRGGTGSGPRGGGTIPDLDEVDALLREADLHIGHAEALLHRLACDQSAPIRQMRAALYIKAMRRLRHLVEIHRTLPWNQSIRHAAPVTAWPSPRSRWLRFIRGWASPAGPSVTAAEP